MIKKADFEPFEAPGDSYSTAQLSETGQIETKRLLQDPRNREQQYKGKDKEEKKTMKGVFCLKEENTLAPACEMSRRRGH